MAALLLATVWLAAAATASTPPPPAPPPQTALTPPGPTDGDPSTDGDDVYDVRRYGARGDGVHVDTAAIAAAFAACAAEGRPGRREVLFPGPGRYVTGPWELGCNDSVVRVAPGATVVSVNTTRGWPLGPDCPEPSQGKTARQAMPFVLGDHAHNVTLTGGGVLDALGPMWWAEHCGNWWCPAWAPNASSAHPYAWRPFMLRLLAASQVRVANLTFRDPGFWCIVPTHSRDITIANVTVLAAASSPNTDGIEPMWTENMHVAGAHISNGDDCITVKSGSRNILVEDVTCAHSHGLTIGSVWYDDVVNVTYRNVVLRSTAAGPRLKGRRQGNATIRDITFANITLAAGVGTGIQVDMDYETPGSTANNSGVTVRGVLFHNVSGPARVAGSLDCLKGRPCLDVALASVHIEAASSTWACRYINLSQSGAVSPPLGAACRLPGYISARGLPPVPEFT